MKHTMFGLLVILGCFSAGLALECDDAIAQIVAIDLKTVDTDANGRVDLTNILWDLPYYDFNKDNRMSKVEIGALLIKDFPGALPVLDQLYEEMDENDDGTVTDLEVFNFLMGPKESATRTTERMEKQPVMESDIYEELYEEADLNPMGCEW